MTKGFFTVAVLLALALPPAACTLAEKPAPQSDQGKLAAKVNGTAITLQVPVASASRGASSG